MSWQRSFKGELRYSPRWIAWLFEPKRDISPEIRSYLLAQLLNSPAAALLGAFCSLLTLLAAFHLTGSPLIGAFIVIEVGLSIARCIDWKTRKQRLLSSSNGTIDVSWSVLLTTLWCTLQGTVAYTLMSGDNAVLQVLSATLIMAMIGPICARNYAAPRFATLLLLLCDLPFVAGAIAADSPILMLIVPMTPPFLLGARQIIHTFHSAILDALIAQEEQRYLASHDSLTGLLNRQGMDEALSRLSPESGASMAIMSLDLDNFKTVNDKYGHGAGDTVLEEVARRIYAAPDIEKIAARMGGDEFMIVIPDCEAQTVRIFGDYLVDALSKQPVVLKSGQTISIGASIGYACLPQDAATTVELRIKADDALYNAKASGKNVCRRFDQGLESFRYTSGPHRTAS